MRLIHNNFRTILAIVIIYALLSQALNYAYGTVSLIFLLCAGIYGLFKNFQTFKSYYLWPILLFILMCSSILWTSQTSQTISGLIRLCPLLIIPLVINFTNNIISTQYEKIFDIFSLIFAFMALVFLIIGLTRYVSLKDDNYLFYHTLVSPSNLNAIYASSFTFVAYIWILLRRYNKLIFQISALILFAFIILLSSKTLIILTLLSSIFLLAYHLKLKFRLMIITLISGFMVIFFFKPNNFISKRYFVESTTNTLEIIQCENFTKVYPWTGFGLRLFQARIAFEIVRENPLSVIFGLGFNASQPLIKDKHKKYNLYPGYYEYNFHNQYLQTFVELGLIGLVILFMCLFQILKISLNHKDLFPFFIFLLFFVLFISESYLMRQRGVMFFTLLYSLMPLKSVNRENMCSN